MSGAFVVFAKTGDANGSGLPKRPLYRAEDSFQVTQPIVNTQAAHSGDFVNTHFAGRP